MIHCPQSLGRVVSRKDAPILCVVGLLALAAVVACFGADQRVLSLLIERPVNWNKNFWVAAFIQLGKAWVLIWLLLVWFLATRRRRAVLAVLLALVIVGIAVNPLKVAVRRPRPVVAAAAQRGQEDTKFTHHLSFPSGDTAVAFSAATAMLPTVGWSLRCLFPAAAAGVGLLRVTTLAHYPSDVLAGAAIGVLAGWIGIRLAGRFLPRADVPIPSERTIAVAGLIVMPLVTGLTEGMDHLWVFLETYGLLALCVIVTSWTIRRVSRVARERQT